MGNVCSCQSGQSQGIDPQTLAPRIKRPAQSSQGRQRGQQARGTTRTSKKEEMQIRRSASNPRDIEVIFGGPLPPRHDQAIRSYATNKSHPYSRPYPTPLQHPKRVRPLTGPPRPTNDLLDSAASSSSTVNQPPSRRPRIALSLRFISSHGASREREREAARKREHWRPTEKDSTAAARRRRREERAQERALRIHSGIPPISSHNKQHQQQHPHEQRGYREPETPNTRQHRKFLEAGIPFAPPPPPHHTRPTTANRPHTSGADRDRRSEPKRGRSKRDTEREWLVQRQDEERQQLKWAKAASKADEEERLRRVRREQQQQLQQPLHFPVYNPTATTITAATMTATNTAMTEKQQSEKEREKRQEEAEWAALLIEQKKKALVMEEERKASVKVRHEGEQRLSRLGLSGKVGLLVGTGIEGLGDREGGMGMAAETAPGAGMSMGMGRETKRHSTTLPVYTATSARITGPLMNEPAMMVEEQEQEEQEQEPLRRHHHSSRERSSREREEEGGQLRQQQSPPALAQVQQQQQQQQQVQSEQEPFQLPLMHTHSQRLGKSAAQREREKAVGDILRWKWVHGKGKSVSSVDEELGLWT